MAASFRLILTRFGLPDKPEAPIRMLMGVRGKPDRILDPLGFEKLIDLRICETRVGSQIDARNLASISRHDWLQHAIPTVGAVDVAGTQMQEPNLAPERHGHKAAAKRQAGAMMVGAYVHRDGVMTMQELFLRLRREPGGRVTMQDAIVEGLRGWCAKHGVTDLKMNG
jgi:hypothetical protein